SGCGEGKNEEEEERVLVWGERFRGVNGRREEKREKGDLVCCLSIVNGGSRWSDMEENDEGEINRGGDMLVGAGGLPKKAAKTKSCLG
ncbi:hypothetical protein HAX54_029241, partial [Datura stramonium]|nr:hypothetical protein [Datura stramonium]